LMEMYVVMMMIPIIMMNSDQCIVITYLVI